MTANIIAALSAFIIHVISALGYPGILLLMAIESACIPLPSEVIMPFSGALTLASIAGLYGRPPFTLFWVALVGAAGCCLGSEIAYLVGYYGGRPLVEKYGSYLLLSRRELDWADRFFQRYGDRTVFISRLLPVVRTFISLPAGVTRMNFGKFLAYTVAGSLIWTVVLVYVGELLGANWLQVRDVLQRFDYLVVLVFLIAVALYVYRHVQHREPAV